MKKNILVYCLTFLLVSSTCLARDFMVEFVEENYKETTTAYSHDPTIYHSIQVNSQAGPKLLILTGENPEYRRWLRHYIAANKNLITRVPDTDNDRFISVKAYEIDVANIHPVNGLKWQPELPRFEEVSSIIGDQHILIIDANDKRRQLISSVIEEMGYTAMVSTDGTQALNTFRIQPEKFKMIITNHELPGMTAETFVDHILKIDQKIPILVETGYQNKAIKNKFIYKFSGAGSVVVKSVVLEDLHNTILKLVKGKV
ncbi:MAG: response regulator [Proteobacteria bacterium]|nr:response regulator [Desulfobacula sp.]MBU3954371.1 response regulator [Pseudomonadota bacterium]MBU4131955.1 response regulator [Pseudomonadota bacterium]